MKKYITTLLLSILTLSAVAQGYKSARIGLVKETDNLYLSYPATAIAVDLLVEKEVVTPGVYARYAQKYLALRAPLAAQTIYSIVDANITVSDDNSQRSLTPEATKVEYTKLPIDQFSSSVLAAEDAAREAAAAIFTIRRQRRDIINGEAGEGYFGAGLKDAMDRLDAMEHEYMELFVGHRTTTQSIERYVFNPLEGANRYVIARFDSKAGILPANDLTGAPIYMQFTIQQIPDTSDIEVGKRRLTVSESQWFRIAAPTQCVLYNDSQPIASSVLSIFEFGKSVEIVIN